MGAAASSPLSLPSSPPQSSPPPASRFASVVCSASHLPAAQRPPLLCVIASPLGSASLSSSVAGSPVSLCFPKFFSSIASAFAPGAAASAVARRAAGRGGAHPLRTFAQLRRAFAPGDGGILAASFSRVEVLSAAFGTPLHEKAFPPAWQGCRAGAFNPEASLRGSRGGILFLAFGDRRIRCFSAQDLRCVGELVLPEVREEDACLPPPQDAPHQAATAEPRETWKGARRPDDDDALLQFLVSEPFLASSPAPLAPSSSSPSFPRAAAGLPASRAFPTVLLCPLNNSVICGDASGAAYAFFLESAQVAARYDPPEALIARQRSFCRPARDDAGAGNQRGRRRSRKGPRAEAERGAASSSSSPFRAPSFEASSSSSCSSSSSSSSSFPAFSSSISFSSSSSSSPTSSSSISSSSFSASSSLAAPGTASPRVGASPCASAGACGASPFAVSTLHFFEKKKFLFVAYGPRASRAAAPPLSPASASSADAGASLPPASPQRRAREEFVRQPPALHDFSSPSFSASCRSPQPSRAAPARDGCGGARWRWPLAVFALQTGACVGCVWGAAAPVVGLHVGPAWTGAVAAAPHTRRDGRREDGRDLWCVAVTQTEILVWRQDARAHKLHRGLHGGRVDCPSFLCGSPSSWGDAEGRTGPCPLFSAPPAASSSAAAAAGPCAPSPAAPPSSSSSSSSSPASSSSPVYSAALRGDEGGVVDGFPWRLVSRAALRAGAAAFTEAGAAAFAEAGARVAGARQSGAKGEDGKSEKVEDARPEVLAVGAAFDEAEGVVAVAVHGADAARRRSPCCQLWKIRGKAKGADAHGDAQLEIRPWRQLTLRTNPDASLSSEPLRISSFWYDRVAQTLVCGFSDGSARLAADVFHRQRRAWEQQRAEAEARRRASASRAKAAEEARHAAAAALASAALSPLPGAAAASPFSPFSSPLALDDGVATATPERPLLVQLPDVELDESPWSGAERGERDFRSQSSKPLQF